MAKLLTLNKHCLYFTAAFCFAHGEQNLIKFHLYNYWSAQAANNISESAMLNSSRPIKFAHLQKWAYQSTLNGADVIKIIKTCTVALMKARNCLDFWRREKHVNWKKQKMVKIYFLKFLLIDSGQHRSLYKKVIICH